MSFQERKKIIQEKNNQRKENREKVSKSFEFKTTMEEAKFEMVQECNGITFEITRKAYNQVRGKKVSFGLNKQEVEKNIEIENVGVSDNVDLDEKEIAIISLLLSTCKVIMGDSNKNDVNKLLNKLNKKDS